MDQSSSLSKARNPGMFLGDLVDRTSFAPLHKLGRWAGLVHQRPVFTHSGQRYAFLVVIKTKAKTMPCQQT
ncbi:MAG: hypothetical protein GY742_19365 [Hyphomicrobiales bacterium]|nr:hypothetical protein [Hyphomicrobiales bacterium]